MRRKTTLVLFAMLATMLTACAGVVDDQEEPSAIATTPAQSAFPSIVPGDAPSDAPSDAPAATASLAPLPVGCTEEVFLNAAEAVTGWGLYDLAPGFTANFTNERGDAAYAAYLAPDRYSVQEPGKADAVAIGTTLWSRSEDVWTTSTIGDPRKSTFPTTALFFAHIDGPSTAGLRAEVEVKASGDPFDGCLFVLADDTTLMTDTLGRPIGYHGPFATGTIDAAIYYEPLPVIEPPV